MADNSQPYRDAISDTVRKLSEGAGVPPALLHAERASGTPRDAAPATHTGRPAHHPGQRVIMCPMGAVSPNAQQCQFPGSDYRPDLYKHLKYDHSYSEEAIREYLTDVWYADEPRGDWKDRTFFRRYGMTGDRLRAVTLGQPGRGKTVVDPVQSMYAGLLNGLQKVTEVQDSEVWQVPDSVREAEAKAALAKLEAEAVHVPLGTPKCPKDGCELTHPHLHSKAEMMSEDHCDHPNGFGPNGCPCGAVREGEDDEPTFRNIETGKDEPGVRCPVTLDCMHGIWPVSKIREHVCGEHGWYDTRFDTWAESVGLKEPVQDHAELDAFLNPYISTEELVAEVNPLEQVLTEWWLARATKEAQEVVPKAIEYGSNSLMQLGRKMAQLQGRTVDDDEALELGCWANLIQKVERFTDSVMRGERPSDDTIYDIGIYTKMVQRIRDAGSWPGV